MEYLNEWRFIPESLVFNFAWQKPMKTTCLFLPDESITNQPTSGSQTSSHLMSTIFHKHTIDDVENNL